VQLACQSTTVASHWIDIIKHRVRRSGRHCVFTRTSAHADARVIASASASFNSTAALELPRVCATLRIDPAMNAAAGGLPR